MGGRPMAQVARDLRATTLYPHIKYISKDVKSNYVSISKKLLK